MDQRDAVSWLIFAIGALVCLAAFGKGALSLFDRRKDMCGNSYWDVDGGGIFIAIFIFFVGLVVLGLSLEAVGK